MENLVNEKLFGGIYEGKRVLITGHSGFKGSWLSLWLKQMGAVVSGFSLNDLTSPSHFELVNSGIETFHGDVRDRKLLETVFSKVKPDIVFHLAAQSLVRESYRDPIYTYETNVMGTLNVLDVALKTPGIKAFVNVTTDKVYENLEQATAFREHDKLGGNDMYSSSKACSEILTISFRNSFLKDHPMLLASARAGNVIGGGDWANERLVPDLVLGTQNNIPAEIRSPKSIRPWEHVLEPLSGYLLLGQKLLEGKKEFADSWNFGPKPEQTLEVGIIVDLMQKQWSKIRFKINEAEAKKFHEAGILMLDCSKASGKLKWEAVWDINTTINKTANWYKDFYENKKVNTLDDLHAYINDAKQQSIIWTN
ncbi:MAG TPA: CDP-glucose 4,6-dehydratase [Bacteroidia bacterium]